MARIWPVWERNDQETDLGSQTKQDIWGNHEQISNFNENPSSEAVLFSGQAKIFLNRRSSPGLHRRCVQLSHRTFWTTVVTLLNKKRGEFMREVPDSEIYLRSATEVDDTAPRSSTGIQYCIFGHPSSRITTGFQRCNTEYTRSTECSVRGK